VLRTHFLLFGHRGDLAPPQGIRLLVPWLLLG
jgi:hypothetical protein